MLVATRAQDPKGPVAAKQSTSGGAPVEVRLADGSSVRMNLTQPNIEIATKYGKLTIPANEIRKVEFGFRYPDGAEDKIHELVNRLGDSNYKRRESAAAELAPFREMAYPALKRATRSTDAEMSKRAAELVQKLEEKYAPEKLKFRDYDLVTAVDFTARGRIEAKTLQGHTPYFGEVRMQIAEVKALRSMAFGGETTVQIDSSKHLDQAMPWMDTDLDLTDDTPLEIVASGQVSLYRGGGYECGPKGHASYSNGTHLAGALLGRIGSNGEIFLIGDKYNGTPKGSGKLYLRMAHSPWPQQANGSYKVVITPNPIR
jgi:hypothetical protein